MIQIATGGGDDCTLSGLGAVWELCGGSWFNYEVEVISDSRDCLKIILDGDP